MATQIKSMTVSEFAKAAGISAAAVSRLIRDGKLKAKKEGAKWMIPPSQLDAKAARAVKERSKPVKRKPSAAGPGRSRPAPSVAATPPPEAPAAEITVSPAPEPAQALSAPEPAAPVQPMPEARPEEKTYTIAEFAAMTYLTEKGVGEWLKSGRIMGIQKESGEWQVLASNLLVPDISRLVRR